MNLIINFKIPIEQDGPAEYCRAIAQKLKLDQSEISLGEILSKNIDLRNKDQFFYQISLIVTVDDSFKNKQNFAIYDNPEPPKKQGVTAKTQPIIIGFGPAGMFAALELIRYGLQPVIFERGKKIADRTLDVTQFMTTRTLNPESNIQFGEGGAGSYSDGKLFSRRNRNTGYINRVLKTLVQFGAPPEIEYIGKPHLGTDVLCTIVSNIRAYILEHGGKIHYNAKMTDLLISKGKAVGVQINHNREYAATNIYIALGHSARQTFKMLFAKGVAMEQRPISVGIRIEHPVQTINLMRYGDKYHQVAALGAAAYSLNYTNRSLKRGVYTFCMCPGGEVVNASSSQGQLVLNGMSYSRRNSAFSNAALVARCHVSDYQSSHPLAGLAFQQDIEQKAFKAGGGTWTVPAQNLLDFLGERSSVHLNTTSCKLGVTQADIRTILPDFAIEHLLAAFRKWRTEVPLFITHEALIMAAETRTSSPVRLLRKKYEAISIKNLHPIGEGSGYTGGITSSAADAIKAVEHIVS